MSTKYKAVFELVAKVFLFVVSIKLLAVVILGFYLFGYYQGVGAGKVATERTYSNYATSFIEEYINQPTPVVTVKTQPPPPKTSGLLRNSDWGGPDLWDAVNKRRQEFGVNPLNQKDNLCTVASIRLNELLDLGTLDGHEGFSNMTQRRPDLENIFDGYSTVAEFLAAGGDSAQGTVDLWENSLGHKKLLTGGEYVWGCIYAQNSFAVAITAF